ncbi:MAG TPA: enoyl-CoA hydratase/isomerase family protein [Galbitalea sp.]|jgi:enoyl-CoA hydratase/carnithine racemase|nr:enoyl-CoA hydratase/isomerase family protein [Galbitalea sp.]
MSDVSFERQDDVALITLSRAERRNALDPQMLAELDAHLIEFDQASELRAAVIRGAGPVFCAGAKRETGEVPQEPKRSHGNGPGLAQLVVNLRENKPVIAAVHGYAIGGGVRILLHCDLVLAGRSTLFRVPEILLGLEVRPLWELIRARANTGFADDVCLTGRYWTAEEAHAAGVVQKVVEDADVFQASLEAAAELGALPANALNELVGAKREILRKVESGVEHIPRRRDSSANTNGGN